VWCLRTSAYCGLFALAPTMSIQLVKISSLDIETNWFPVFPLPLPGGDPYPNNILSFPFSEFTSGNRPPGPEALRHPSYGRAAVLGIYRFYFTLFLFEAPLMKSHRGFQSSSLTHLA